MRSFSAFILFLIGASCALHAGEPARFYVATDGSDAWSGRLAAPNAARTDGPFASLERAQSAVRAAGPSGGVEVNVRGGVYARRQALRLEAADSGTGDHPVVWRAFPGEHPVLSGSVGLTRFDPVTAPAVRQRLRPEVVAHVLHASLPAHGVSDYGQLEQRGSPGLELFYRGERMQLARYPNAGWLLIADVPQTGPQRLNEGLDRERRFKGIPAGRHYGRITFSDPRPATWAADPNLYAHGFWTWDWSDSFQRIAAIDAAKREITFAAPHHHYGYTQNQRFYFVNVLEELDRPGEWYLDRASGDLYFYPPGPVTTGDVEVSVLNEPFFTLVGAHDVQVVGFACHTSRGGGARISGGESCAFLGCEFRNLGAFAVEIDGGRSHEVRSCDAFDLALGAIRVAGGDRPTLTPSGHRIHNNHLHHISRWLRAGPAGIAIEGVGQQIAHNLIHDTPFEGLTLKGNDHVLEFNEVHHVTLETGDAGAIHTGRDYTWRGNVIRHNYWHDLKGPGLHGATAVYLDDFSSGFTVSGNLFYRAGRGIQIGGGRDNIVAGNVFIECEPAVHLDARGLGWASNYFDGRYPYLTEQFAAVHGDRPPYTDRYPALRTLLGDQPAHPKGNRIVNNLSWGGRWLDVYDFFAFDFARCVELRDDAIADPVLLRRRAQDDGKPDPYFLNIDATEGYLAIRRDDPAASRELPGNAFFAEPPARFDPVTRTFVVTNPAALERLGIARLPIEKMGLQPDEFRRRR
ncbi:right-handed parallel beta-helix repeat-containing protein [Opitutus sp. ER46]|uniref:right-handed parallel beta-helix repeat-containing protein n=1 Tax=Opitutus sp. ER46 TaxID=2161864 RepID=UPI000D2FE006|nr:right-handed parallel beta-helix repeat-containing protein [Opitutus sp. ER46]PTX94466.1 hypothetical protein DB354_12030 [Opitutus sp. ER46]